MSTTTIILLLLMLLGFSAELLPEDNLEESTIAVFEKAIKHIVDASLNKNLLLRVLPRRTFFRGCNGDLNRTELSEKIVSLAKLGNFSIKILYYGVDENPGVYFQATANGHFFKGFASYTERDKSLRCKNAVCSSDEIGRELIESINYNKKQYRILDKHFTEDFYFDHCNKTISRDEITLMIGRKFTKMSFKWSQWVRESGNSNIIAVIELNSGKSIEVEFVMELVDKDHRFVYAKSKSCIEID